MFHPPLLCSKPYYRNLSFKCSKSHYPYRVRSPAVMSPYAESRCLSLGPLRSKERQVQRSESRDVPHGCMAPTPTPQKRALQQRDKWSRAPSVHTMQRENETRVRRGANSLCGIQHEKKKTTNHCNKHVGKYEKDHATLHKRMALN